jgi:cysteinyl-tRNA synthetase
VEDKIIARAAAEGVSESDVATRSEAAWFAQMDRVGVRRPDAVPHATGYVERMIRLIAELVERGAAYAVEDQGVYFSVRSFPSYGALSNRTLDELGESAGARVETDELKRSPMDFALWKAAKPGDPAWDSPWGPGRPGWHIECSAMSLDLLGEGFDLHGGGEDLLFPHHENERAQAEGAGHPFARYWLHNGLVLAGGDKMSRSVGNFTTLADALDRHGGRAYRVAVLQTHYRRQMELGASELEAAAKAVDRLDALFRRARAVGVEEREGSVDGVVERFRAAMDDDFATPSALAAIFDAVGSANIAIDRGDAGHAGQLLATVRGLADVLGLTIGATAAEDAEIDTLVRERDEARARRDFASADRIRDELAARSVLLEDTPTGTVWHR